MQPNIGCGICDRCVAGSFHLCDDYRAFGINMDGGFAEYVKIPAEAVMRGNLMPLPEGVTAEEAAITEPVACALNGFNKCFVKPGDYALIVGAGPIGYSHAVLLHMAGALVLMNDLSRERLELCKKNLPFIQVYHGNDLEGFVMEWTNGKGLDIAITASGAGGSGSCAASHELWRQGEFLWRHTGQTSACSLGYQYSALQGIISYRFHQVQHCTFT